MLNELKVHFGLIFTLVHVYRDYLEVLIVNAKLNIFKAYFFFQITITLILLQRIPKTVKLPIQKKVPFLISRKGNWDH